MNPYSKKRYESRKKYRKYKRCVKKIKKKGGVKSPFAICQKSIYGGKKMKKPKGWRGESRRHRVAALKGLRKRKKPNWKLVDKLKYGLTWKNLNTYGELWIYDLGVRLGTKSSGKWSGHYNGKLLFRNKTKAQAIKFAKSWMKKHPRG